MLKAFVFDLETNGRPKNYYAPVSLIDNWPHIVQIGWCVIDTEDPSWNRVGDFNIRLPEGVNVDRKAQRVHGVTDRQIEDGFDFEWMLESYLEPALEGVDVAVCHNTGFDIPTLKAAMLRHTGCLSELFNRLPSVCTMRSTVDFCEIPGTYGYKWPSLSELHQKLFGCNPPVAHKAFADASTTAKCYRELVRLHVLPSSY